LIFIYKEEWIIEIKELNEINKPKAKIIGADGNVFNLIGICRRALKDASLSDKADEMTSRITSSSSYEDALSIMCEYIEPVDQNGYDLNDEFDYDDIEIWGFNYEWRRIK